MEKGKLTQGKADKAGHESPGEDCGLPHQTVGVSRQFPVWLCPVPLIPSLALSQAEAQQMQSL